MKLSRLLRLMVTTLIALLIVCCTYVTLGDFDRPVVARSAERIMPLGDSITAGTGSTSLGGYRLVLWEDGMAAHWHFTFVGSQKNGPAILTDKDHEGHPGWRIDQISAHVLPWLRTYQPQIILLQIGTNDIIHHYYVGSAPARLAYLLNQITTTLPSAIVIVAQVTPLRNRALNAEIVTYNRSIPSIVERMDAQGRHVECVDMYDAVPVGDLVDGIHPDDQGYALMAGAWYRALQPIM